MNVERQIRRTRRWLVFWRLMGDVIGVPRTLCRALDKCLLMFERTIFYLELDAARRYRALTGADLAIGLGEPNRYSGLDIQSANVVHERFTAALEAGEE